VDSLSVARLLTGGWRIDRYQLFENYQRNVHKEEPHEISAAGFKRFLCVSPLPTTTTASGKRLGSYHMCYRLDGRLVAMGVLDLLPDIASSVYFIYHSDYESWHLGKVSACHEVCLAKEEGYGYYYMGNISLRVLQLNCG